MNRTYGLISLSLSLSLFRKKRQVKFTEALLCSNVEEERRNGGQLSAVDFGFVRLDVSVLCDTYLLCFFRPELINDHSNVRRRYHGFCSVCKEKHSDPKTNGETVFSPLAISR